MQGRRTRGLYRPPVLPGGYGQQRLVARAVHRLFLKHLLHDVTWITRDAGQTCSSSQFAQSSCRVLDPASVEPILRGSDFPRGWAPCARMFQDRASSTVAVAQRSRTKLLTLLHHPRQLVAECRVLGCYVRHPVTQSHCCPLSLI